MLEFHSTHFARQTSLPRSRVRAPMPEGAHALVEADKLIVTVDQPDINWMLGRYDRIPALDLELAYVHSGGSGVWYFTYRKEEKI